MTIAVFAVAALIVLSVGQSAAKPEKSDPSTRSYPDVEDQVITTATVIACNVTRRFIEVRHFLHGDLPWYDKVTYDIIDGSAPVAYFYNKDGRLVKEIALKKKTREECKKMMADHGFVLREKPKPKKKKKKKPVVEEEEEEEEESDDEQDEKKKGDGEFVAKDGIIVRKRKEL
ncbi:hypothetical protein HDE_09692 [Halotydeus destructor]|nr:hypothetical protein HDE_09692 [Halotydeus destructor]